MLDEGQVGQQRDEFVEAARQTEVIRQLGHGVREVGLLQLIAVREVAGEVAVGGNSSGAVRRLQFEKTAHGKKQPAQEETYFQTTLQNRM